jgi:hypothetical protein
VQKVASSILLSICILTSARANDRSVAASSSFLDGYTTQRFIRFTRVVVVFYFPLFLLNDWRTARALCQCARRLLVCHDMKVTAAATPSSVQENNVFCQGGYTDDAELQVFCCAHDSQRSVFASLIFSGCWAFRRLLPYIWRKCGYFCVRLEGVSSISQFQMNTCRRYFSHHNITIPPPPWINCCHANGTAVLGTIIFEWDAGAALCRRFLFRTKDGSLSQEAVIFCENLVTLCCQMHFDGYLINIECALTPDEVLILLDWLSMLRTRLKSCICHSMLIWYDAVTIEGALVWQNALNTKNKPFFDICDGMFLNYAWTQSAAASSAAAAGNRKCDVFLGVDIFGRGTFGGGKLNSHTASAVAQVCGVRCLIVRGTSLF